MNKTKSSRAYVKAFLADALCHDSIGGRSYLRDAGTIQRQRDSNDSAVDK